MRVEAEMSPQAGHLKTKYQWVRLLRSGEVTDAIGLPI